MRHLATTLTLVCSVLACGSTNTAVTSDQAPPAVTNVPSTHDGGGGSGIPAAGDASATEALPTSKRGYVTLAPFVLADDEGRDPAASSISLESLNRVYERANIEFAALDPMVFPLKTGRDGEINLDQLTQAAKDGGYYRGDGDVLNVYFVNAVDGKKGPLGRGMMGGPVLYVALGPDMDDAMTKFVVAHEIGHCFGLRHIVDEPDIPDDLVNLMGDGPFAERLDPKGLTEAQIATVRQSRLVAESR